MQGETMPAEVGALFVDVCGPQTDAHLRRSISHEWGPAEIDRLVSEARDRRAEATRAWLRSLPKPLAAKILLSIAVMIGMVILARFGGPNVLPLVMVSIFVAAALSSIAGFAFSAVCGALLLHQMPPVAAVQLMIACSIAIQGASVLALRRAIDWRPLLRFLTGGIISLPIGVALLLALDAHIYARIMGVFLIAYGVFMLLRPKTTIGWQRGWADALAGACGGITGGFAGFPGAFVTIWCALKGWDKDRQRGIYQPYILIMQIVSLPVISFASAGLHRPMPLVGTDWVIYVSMALLGTWCGLALYRKLSDAQFGMAVNMLLILAGGGLVI